MSFKKKKINYKLFMYLFKLLVILFAHLSTYLIISCLCDAEDWSNGWEKMQC